MFVDTVKVACQKCGTEAGRGKMDATRLEKNWLAYTHGTSVGRWRMESGKNGNWEL